MAWGNYVLDLGMDVATGQQLTKFTAVKYSGEDQCTPVTTIADVIAGFCQFNVTTADIANGKGATVRAIGVTEAVAAGAIAVGNMVQLEATGQVSAYVAASGKRIVGKCVGVPATNPGDRISLLIHPTGVLA